MNDGARIGRNNPCPCGSGKKYKACCQSTVPWPEILRRGPSAIVRHLSARGKNILFLNTIAEVLQLDKVSKQTQWADIKRACTPEAVSKIHLAVTEIWPDAADAERILREQSSSTSGLYIGGYEPQRVLRGVTRHALYADRLLLFDPFTDPRGVRPRFSPLERPEEWRSATLWHLRLWWSLAPWIQEGLVLFVKQPGDFDSGLLRQCCLKEEERLAKNKDLQIALDKDAENDPLIDEGDDFNEFLLFLTPEDKIEARVREQKPQTTDAEMSALREYVRERKSAHPYYVDAATGDQREGQIIQWSTGASYEMAKVTAAVTGSFLLTDISSRWIEMQIDRKDLGVDANAWEPFAKAFGSLPFRFLNNVPLDLALQLRREERLGSFRAFLRRVWRTSASDEPFDSRNAAALGGELEACINEAEAEWSKIDQDLLKWLGVGAATQVAMAGPRIAQGGAEWLGVALVVQGITQLAVAGIQRRGFNKRYPASFFLKMKRQNTG